MSERTDDLRSDRLDNLEAKRAEQRDLKAEDALVATKTTASATASRELKSKLGTGERWTFVFVAVGYGLAFALWLVSLALAQLGVDFGIDQIVGHSIRLASFVVLNTLSSLIEIVIVLEASLLVLWLYARSWRSFENHAQQSLRSWAYRITLVHSRAIVFWIGAPAVAVWTTSGSLMIFLWLFSWAFLRIFISQVQERKCSPSQFRLEKQLERFARPPTVAQCYVGTLAYLTVLYCNVEVRAAILPVLALVALGAVIRLAFLAWTNQEKLDEPRAKLTFKITVAVYVVVALIPVLLTGPRFFGLPSGTPTLSSQRPSEEPKTLEAGLNIYFLSDNQFRDLDGTPASAHMQLVESLFSSSMRPVVLDLLSESSFAQLVTVGQKLATHTGTVFAHLGDFADLSCASEFSRIAPLRGRQDQNLEEPRLVGMAIGNHDGYFLGNFLWFPGWQRVCRSEPVPRAGALSRVAAFIAGKRPRELTAATSIGAPFLASVTELGAIDGSSSGAGSESTTVVGAFLDTSNADGSWLGWAGSEGHVSGQQVDWVLKTIGRFPKSSVVVLMQHHPLAALSSASQANMRRLIKALDGRVLAVVASHTHRSSVIAKPPSLGPLGVVQLVVGSTTDPPQSSAVLNIRKGKDTDELQLYFETIQLVDRQSEHESDNDTRRAEGLLTADVCRAHLSELQSDRRCKKLLEHKSDYSVLKSPVEVRRAQRSHARALFDCLGVDIAETERVFSDESRQNLLDVVASQLRGDPTHAAQKRLCISWAASWMEENRELTLERAFEASLCRPSESESPSCRVAAEKRPPMPIRYHFEWARPQVQTRIQAAVGGTGTSE